VTRSLASMGAHLARCAFAPSLVFVALAAAGSPGKAATTLDELLREVRAARAAEEKGDAERERTFLAHRDKQQKLLQEALAARAAQEARSKALSSQYDVHDREITQLSQLLAQREGSLGELFGVTRQVAGEVASTLSQSLIGLQFPGREAPLVTMAGTKVLPTIAELEGLWLEMLREISESGRVVRFEAQLAAPDGTVGPGEVVRIGPFIAMRGGDYLRYQPGMKQLAVLPRQPPGDFAAAAARVTQATSGYVEAGVDPSRGVLLALTVERPTVLERIKKGELVGAIIIAVGVIASLLALYQLIFLVRTRALVTKQLAHLDRPAADNPVGRVLLAFRGDGARIEEDAAVAELRLSEAVLREVPRIERFQGFLRLAVAAGPLLGLIGTVIGMIITFQSITESGSSDPKLMAAGIGQAMIATVLGLGIAIPLLFANALLATLSGHVVQVLDEQSAGLLAESLEKRRGA
jgi:biopolymer transport protein ExbB